jgi:hypothetical protein
VRLIVTFYSISSALLLDAALKEQNFPCALIPAPRKLGSSCGYAADVEAENTEPLIRLLRGAPIEWEALWRQDGNGYEALCRNG